MAANAAAFPAPAVTVKRQGWRFLAEGASAPARRTVSTSSFETGVGR